MKYESLINSNRVEFVEAESDELALMKISSLCEEKESPVYLREKFSGKVVWALFSFLR